MYIRLIYTDFIYKEESLFAGSGMPCRKGRRAFADDAHVAGFGLVESKRVVAGNIILAAFFQHRDLSGCYFTERFAVVGHINFHTGQSEDVVARHKVRVNESFGNLLFTLQINGCIHVVGIESHVAAGAVVSVSLQTVVEQRNSLKVCLCQLPKPV